MIIGMSDSVMSLSLHWIFFCLMRTSDITMIDMPIFSI